jgi:NADH-quinone oxidoreductase subunit C
MTDTSFNSLAERLAARFGEMLTISVVRNEVTAEVAAADLLAVAAALRDEAPFRFGVPIDICGIDYLGYGQTEWGGRRGDGSLQLG